MKQQDHCNNSMRALDRIKLPCCRTHSLLSTMVFGSSGRVSDYPKSPKHPMARTSLFKVMYDVDGIKIPEASFRNFVQQEPDKDTTKSLKAKVLSRVFSEDYDKVNNKVLDPRGSASQTWNKIFFVARLVSLFVDPLFFYIPVVHLSYCVSFSMTLQVVLTVARSISDVFYILNICVRFRTAYIAPSSRVFGRGELVIDPSMIARQYLQKEFWIDLIVALPLPQVLLWVLLSSASGSPTLNEKNVLLFVISFQYLPRLYLIFPLISQIINSTGSVMEKAWFGAAYNLMLFLLAAEIMGSCFYIYSVERQEACWKLGCSFENGTCYDHYFDCRSLDDPDRSSWLASTNVSSFCLPSTNQYTFGIYGQSVISNATSATFMNRYFYFFWWGLQNLCCLGQNLVPGTYVGEICFCIQVSVTGLVLFAWLIANMQRYLQTTTVRLEEWRLRRTDTEEWMHHRQLPRDLRQAVRKYDQYKWVATRGVDEASLLKGLPLDLRREIKRYLCLDLIRRVPLFDQMNDTMLDAICERLKPALCTEGTFPVREGDPINEMLFIIRGNIDSYTTDSGRVGFFNSFKMGPGDFFGEELLPWALDPRPTICLPSSTRTMKAVTEVEAFALKADDLKFVATQFRRLHSRQIRHKFRFHSHQWRTWAACFIQAAWRRYKRRKRAAEVKVKESSAVHHELEEGEDEGLFDAVATPVSAFAICAARAMENARRNGGVGAGSRSSVGPLVKPAEPDFASDEIHEI